MNGRRPALAVLVLTVALLRPVPAAAAGPPVDYVALGDSYAAGLGSPGATGWCGRSPQSYPQQWVARRPVRSFAFVACNGATTVDLRAYQLSALDAGTDLVSVTIGGNDAGFAPTVGSCLVTDDRTCADAVGVARAVIRHVLPARLDATYRAIRDRSPAARVVVLGYPRLFERGPCPGGLSAAKRDTLNAGADELDTVIAARAAAAGFRYVDVRAAFAGHGICSDRAWVNTVSLLRPLDSYHPNTAGYTDGYLPGLTAAAG